MKIVIACGSGCCEDWADPSIDKGIGGSEESVIYVARELSRLGHDVVVSNRCGELAGFYFDPTLLELEGERHGVTYQPWTEPLPACDVLIAWRDWRLLSGRHAPVQWLWCHDIPVEAHCPGTREIAAGALRHIDKFVLLNAYHAEIYDRIPEAKKFVCEIGVELSHFDQAVERIPGRVIYFSHPDRGLHRLRQYWPEVKRRVPHATLAAFWWEENFHLPPDESLGILPMRRAGHRELAAEILSADVLGYPSVFQPEISPATTIKSQIGGAVPIVVPQGGMRDTVKFGMMTTHADYPAALAAALLDREWLESTRPDMMAWGRETYDWAKVARRWTQEFTNIKS